MSLVIFLNHIGNSLLLMNAPEISPVHMSLPLV